MPEAGSDEGAFSKTRSIMAHAARRWEDTHLEAQRKSRCQASGTGEVAASRSSLQMVPSWLYNEEMSRLATALTPKADTFV